MSLPTEVTLEDYVALVNENLALKEKIEDDGPWMKWVHFAHMIDSYRIFPRLFMIVYMILLITSGNWFMGLAEPLASQSAFVSTIWAAGAAWFGLYVNTGWKHNKQ